MLCGCTETKRHTVIQQMCGARYGSSKKRMISGVGCTFNTAAAPQLRSPRSEHLNLTLQTKQPKAGRGGNYCKGSQLKKHRWRCCCATLILLGKLPRRRRRRPMKSRL